MRTPRISQARIDRAQVRLGGLAAFTKRAWSQVVPEQLRWNWHHDLVCDHLERLYRGEIRNLLIEIPPGTTKSLMTQVFFPAWIWTEDPTEKF
ncbi:MAG: phage terminase large subunit, partial [Planctomycetota bacterium]